MVNSELCGQEDILSIILEDTGYDLLAVTVTINICTDFLLTCISFLALSFLTPLTCSIPEIAAYFEGLLKQTDTVFVVNSTINTGSLFNKID